MLTKRLLDSVQRYLESFNIIMRMALASSEYNHWGIDICVSLLSKCHFDHNYSICPDLQSQNTISRYL